MRMLSGVEAPDSGTRREGHQVVMQYFAQDEATRLDPDAARSTKRWRPDSPNDMVPAIRNILGGFLFSGDDVYKKVGVLSGGERTRLAVARMLLRPSNTLLLDEPTNHLDLDSKDILLEALEDYGGTLIFVSHDRYFVEKLANKIVEIGHGERTVFPGTYTEFLWSKEQRAKQATGRRPRSRRRRRSRPASAKRRERGRTPNRRARRPPHTRRESASRPQQRKRDAEDEKAPDARIAELEASIAEREQAIKDLEAAMSAPGFYDNRDAAQPLIDRHQALMWEVGDLMHQWEELQRRSLSDSLRQESARPATELPR